MKTPERNTSVAVIDGGLAQREKRFRQLLSEPHTFEQAEFESLVDQFTERLSIDEIMALVARRVRARPYADTLDAQLLSAIIEGRTAEADRLSRQISRRNTLGLRVIETTAPGAPDRSS